MSEKSEEFLNIMLNFLPSTNDEYKESINDNGEVLETVIIEDIFMPVIINLLQVETNVQLLKEIFNYFEEVSNCHDDHLINIFSITVMEILGNDRKVLEIAKKYMGNETIKLQIEADKDLGRL